MRKIDVRLCELSDISAIQKLSSEELGYYYPIDKLSEKLTSLIENDANRIFVAVLEGEVVGYVHAVDYDLLYAPHYKNIMGLAVASNCRHQGIGSALLEAVELWAKSSGADSIRLTSGEERIGAHQFYKYCGYITGKKQFNFKKKL